MKGKKLTKYILWSPEGETNPFNVYSSYPEAEEVLVKMAKKYRGQKFYVMEAKSYAIKEEVTIKYLDESLESPF